MQGPCALGIQKLNCHLDTCLTQCSRGGKQDKRFMQACLRTLTITFMLSMWLTKHNPAILATCDAVFATKLLHTRFFLSKLEKSYM